MPESPKQRPVSTRKIRNKITTITKENALYAPNLAQKVTVNALNIDTAEINRINVCGGGIFTLKHPNTSRNFQSSEGIRM